MKLSLVIPVYNVEKYLTCCLDSCVLQKNVALNEDYEIICIDDGSTDTSKDILDDYERKYGVRVLHYQNAGVSAARNKGMKMTKGEYIWFIDSDDYIAYDAVSLFFQMMHDNPSDIYRFSFKKVMESEKVIVSYGGQLEPILAEQWNQGRAESYVWTYIIKKSVLVEHNLSFEEGVIFEDIIWQTSFWAKGLTPKYYGNILYFYRNRSGSIVHTRNAELYMHSMMKMQEVYGELLHQEDVLEIRKVELENKYKRMTGNILWAELMLQKNNSKELIAYYRERGLYPYPIQWSSLMGGGKSGNSYVRD